MQSADVDSYKRKLDKTAVPAGEAVIAMKAKLSAVYDTINCFASVADREATGILHLTCSKCFFFIFTCCTLLYSKAVLLKLFNIVYRQRTFCHSTYQSYISNEKNKKTKCYLINNNHTKKIHVKNAFILIPLLRDMDLHLFC